MDKILCVIKDPGEPPRVEHIENTLEALQKAVGGYIETFTIATDLIIICNEEGLLHNLPYNCHIANCPFVGTIVAVSAKGDEFASIKAQNIPFVLDIMGREQ